MSLSRSTSTAIRNRETMEYMPASITSDVSCESLKTADAFAPKLVSHGHTLDRLGHPHRQMFVARASWRRRA